MSQLKPPPGEGDHAQGSREAPVTIVEYGDFQCPYCGDAYPQLKAVQEALGDSLCFVFRNFPLNNAHPHAEHAAEFAEGAAAIGKFWEMHDRLYENQDALDDGHLKRYAVELGMDAALIARVMQGEFATKVRHDFTSGVRSGVNGTPCLFINGVRYDGPAEAQSILDAVASLAR